MSRHKQRDKRQRCGHPGTIHLVNDPEASEECRICGTKLDQYGNEVALDA